MNRPHLIKNERARKLTLEVLMFALFLIAVFYLAGHVAKSEWLQGVVSRFGYLGIFIVSVISGFNIIVPIPVISFLPVLIEADLKLWATILTITLGMTTGDILSYLIGLKGRSLLVQEEEKNKHHFWFMDLILRAEKKHKWWPYLLLFFFVTVVPLPNELTVLPMGLLGFKMSIIIPILIVGNFIFNFLSAQGILALFGII